MVEYGSIPGPVPENHEEDGEGKYKGDGVVKHFVGGDHRARDEPNGESPIDDIENSGPDGDVL